MQTIHEVGSTKVKKIKKDGFKIETAGDINYSFIYKYFFNDDDNVKLTDKSIVFNASDVKSLTEFLKENKNEMEYMLVIDLLKNLAMMKEILESKGIMFINLDLDDIIVIDSKRYLYVNYDNLYKLEGEDIIVEEIIDKFSKFMPKKEIDTKTIPLKINIKSIYYNIADLLIYCLFNKQYKDKETIVYLYQTKLYWFLQRCLDEDISKRVFLFI
jgi:hypothetical protein